MRHWIVGDLQGCCDDLLRLLDQIRFEPATDRLWIAGDLVNRGPDSLRTLRTVHALRDQIDCVLGNHDLHLLAEAAGVAPKPQPDLHPILHAPDRDELLDWVATRPLARHFPAFNTLLVHAGVHRDWTVEDALQCSAEVQARLAGAGRGEFLRSMYGNEPAQWQPELTGMDRLRIIVNCFTRMRYCHADGSLDLNAKGTPETTPDATPWFALPDRASHGTRIVFGHWSTLGTVRWPSANVVGLDTGCVWGGSLTALCLEDDSLAAVPCPAHQTPG